MEWLKIHLLFNLVEKVFFNFLEECAFRFIYLPKINEEEAVDGIELLRQAYSIHRDDSEVVESICRVFKQFCIYGKTKICENFK